MRDHGTTTLTLRPRRARCRACQATHVLLPAVIAPRRADTTAVIGAALQASARGVGYRRIATGLDRPLSTVRRWIRAVRDLEHVEWLRARAVDWIARVIPLPLTRRSTAPHTVILLTFDSVDVGSAVD